MGVPRAQERQAGPGQRDRHLPTLLEGGESRLECGMQKVDIHTEPTSSYWGLRGPQLPPELLLVQLRLWWGLQVLRQRQFLQGHAW